MNLKAFLKNFNVSRYKFFILISSLLLTFSVTPYLSRLNFSDPYVREGVIFIQDFRYHQILFKKFWQEPGEGNLYQHEFQREAIIEATGHNVDSTMPVGVMPVAPLYSIPFILLENINSGLPYFIWILISIFTFIVGTSKLADQKKISLVEFSILIVAVTLSEVLNMALMLGQPIIFVVGLLCLLFYELENNNEKSSYRILIYALLISIKPTYTLLVFFFLLIKERYRLLSIFLGTLLALNLAVGLNFKGNWILDYLHMLNGYVKGEFDKGIITYFLTEQKSSFTIFLSNYMPYIRATFISSVIWKGLLAMSLTLIMYDNFNKKHKFSTIILAIIVLKFVVFQPYTPRYEDLVLIAFYLYFNYEHKDKIKKYFLLTLLTLTFVFKQISIIMLSKVFFALVLI